MINRHLVFAAGVAAGILVFSGCGSAQTVKVTRDKDGNYVAECASNCKIVGQGVSYEVRLKVTADENGTIISVEDNGTEIPKYQDGEYKMAEAMFADLAGKNADTLDEVDTVSGATVSSDSILNATKQGLDAINSSD